MSTIIEQDRAVRIHYHLTDADQQVIDSSEGREPLSYLHGHGTLVPGVEAALAGLKAGDEVDAVVAPEDGYGVRDPELDIRVPIDVFEESVRDKLGAGATFEGPHPTHDGQSARFSIIEVADGQVMATANHPLAGVTLHFKLQVVDVREATAEELAHGHIHGPGGHHH